MFSVENLRLRQLCTGGRGIPGQEGEAEIVRDGLQRLKIWTASRPTLFERYAVDDSSESRSPQIAYCLKTSVHTHWASPQCRHDLMIGHEVSSMAAQSVEEPVPDGRMSHYLAIR